MTNDLLIHATGMSALVLNVIALLRTCERTLRIESGIAGTIEGILLGWSGKNDAQCLT